MSNYLPKCCFVRPDGAGEYEVCHAETSADCKHTPSGGTAGRPDGRTPCNRIVGRGYTRSEAINDAHGRMTLRRSKPMTGTINLTVPIHNRDGSLAYITRTLPADSPEVAARLIEMARECNPSLEAEYIAAPLDKNPAPRL